MGGRRFVIVRGRQGRADLDGLARLGARQRLDVSVVSPEPAPPGWPTGGSWHRLAEVCPVWDLGCDLLARLAPRPRLRFPLQAKRLARDPIIARIGEHPSESTILIATDQQTLSDCRQVVRATGLDVPVLAEREGAEALAQAIADTTARPRPATGGELIPGAMHRVAVVTAPGLQARAEVSELLPRIRSREVHLSGGARPQKADVLVLDGLGPGIADLDGHRRVVYLPRPEDDASPWRHVLSVMAGDLVRGPLEIASDDRLAEVLLGKSTAQLALLTRARKDREALRAAARLLERDSLDILTLQEVVYLSRVLGESTMEERALTKMVNSQGLDAHLGRALSKVRARLQETEPGWLPYVPPVSIEPVPGRVLHVLKVTLPQRQAGYSVRGHETLRALARAGVDVVGVAAPALDSTEPPHPLGLDEVVVDDVRYLVPPPVPSSSPLPLEAQAAALMCLVQKERPSLVHVHSGGRGYDLGSVGAAVAGALGVPWIYEIRGFFESLWTGELERAERGETFRRRMEKEAELANSAAVAITLSESMRNDLLARGVDPAHVHVVPNAVDPGLLRPVPPDLELGQEWAPRGFFTFGYVSNLDHPREQVEDLIEAAALLHRRGEHVRLLIVGEGRRRKHLEDLARRRSLSKIVRFTGAVEHSKVSAAYSLLDVFVVPRSGERAARLVTPLKPFEAMAMGIPVVVSDQPALQEVIGWGRRGFSYPSGDAEALADLLAGLAHDPEARRGMAERARAWVISNRTWDLNADRYREIYASVVP